ncbi:MAG: hypothetical protein H6899_07565 [Rhodobacter sp.]|nr:hypothetical protein [Paracoccaceae bacterium]MCC0079792.1 hypothetical protein [Rhodobacter sp.]
MQSADFFRRMDHVLTERVEAKRTRENPWRLRAMRVSGVLTGAIVCFFLLKGAALASRDAGFAPPLPPDAGFGAQVYYWFAGADPISATLAAALRGPTRG